MAEAKKPELTLTEKARRLAHRFTKLGIIDHSPDLVVRLLQSKLLVMDQSKRAKLRELIKVLQDHNEWCWEEVSEEMRKTHGRDPVLMEAWLDAIKGNKALLKWTKKYRNPSDYPEILEEKWNAD